MNLFARGRLFALESFLSMEAIKLDNCHGRNFSQLLRSTLMTRHRCILVESFIACGQCGKWAIREIIL